MVPIEHLPGKGSPLKETTIAETFREGGAKVGGRRVKACRRSREIERAGTRERDSGWTNEGRRVEKEGGRQEKAIRIQCGPGAASPVIESAGPHGGHG